ncbi:MAG: hypothetical protein COW03_09330 [Cytophagales bacterium CG12_big_fil_rev_8_21_14_0_65_40_12]|nr:MAG: hypothetical protein COW03_09330 [Cytophagales bacterium CG12_big_fil_rev_8_21_14_0_65_40_12]PIW02792.1 MAG: hypothetical protein COW40_18230 [Cytophagales bacterium CG17_big_fil_post_rev_8_21_14_2_50_40_13]
MIKERVDKLPFLLSLATVLLFVSLYWVKGENSYINSFDNLDSVTIFFRSLNQGNAQFLNNETMVDGMIGLQPRQVYPSEFEVLLWLDYFFGTLWAWIINFSLVHLIAFVSFYFFIKRILLNISENADASIEWYASLSALIFALFNFWTNAGLSVAGLGLLGLSILLINEHRLKSALFLTLIYGFYSSFILVGIFVGLIYGVFVIVYIRKLIIERTLVWHSINLLLLGSIYVVVNYRLFSSILFSNFESHRIEFSQSSISKSWNLGSTFDILVHGHNHAANYSAWIGYFSILAAIILLITKKYHQSKTSLLLSSLFLTISISLLFLMAAPIRTQLSQIPLIGMVQLDRFYFLLPFLTLVIFTLGMYYIRFPKALIFKVIIVLALIANSFLFELNWNSTIRDIFGMNNFKSTYHDFYRIKLMTQVKTYLENEDYQRVMSFGMHPAVAIYNGIRSADGYLANYSLESKHRFAEVIENEIAKNEDLESYFLRWGSRAYLYNAQIFNEFDFLKPDQSFKNDFNYKAIDSMGVDYILSVVRILDEQLALETQFQEGDEIIYIYSIKTNKI